MKRACGLDVHKDTIFCATFNGKKHGPVTEYSTLTSSIRTMGGENCEANHPSPVFLTTLHS